MSRGTQVSKTDNAREGMLSRAAQSIVDEYVIAHRTNPGNAEAANKAYEAERDKILAKYPNKDEQKHIESLIAAIWPSSEEMARRIQPGIDQRGMGSI